MLDLHFALSFSTLNFFQLYKWVLEPVYNKGEINVLQKWSGVQPTKGNMVIYFDVQKICDQTTRARK